MGMQQGGGHTPPNRGSLTVADGYLRDGYFDEHGHVRRTIIEITGPLTPTSDSMVARAVYALKNDRASSQRGSESGVAYGQLYRFFQQARAIERRYLNGEPFDALLADLAALRPKVAVIVGRGVAPRAFKDFIDTNVTCVEQAGDILTHIEATRRRPEALRKGFLPHYQSVLCYYKFYTPKS